MSSNINNQYTAASLANDAYGAGLALAKAFNADTTQKRDDALRDFLGSTARAVSGATEIKGLNLKWGLLGAVTATNDEFAYLAA